MRFEIVVACNKKFGIGCNGGLPWSIRDDMRRFREITTKNKIVVMGRKTYESLPSQHRPLNDRINVVLTRHPELYSSTDTVIFTDRAFNTLNDLEKKGVGSVCSVIGGADIYKCFMQNAHRIHMTLVEMDIECDTFFPHQECFEWYELVDHSDVMYDDREKCNFRYLTYEPRERRHGELAYIDLLKDIVKTGISKSDRTGTGTLSVFGRQVRFDIEKSFPLVTTKFVGYKSIIRELLWFLRGDTDATKLAKEGVHIWDKNTSREFLDKTGLHDYKEGDIGPMYGWIWRHVSAEYKGCDHDYSGEGIDQLENVIKLLKTDPFSRRIMMSTYNVSDAEKGCLYPCHGNIVQFNCDVIEGKKYLSCHMYQRSCDVFLGFPYNIASYAVLSYIIAMKVDMIPKEIVISLGDTHIYNNLLSQTLEQIQRRPYPFPKLVVSPSVKEKSWEDINIKDFELVGYHHHLPIKGEMSV